MGLLLRAVDVAGPLRWRWLLTDAETGGLAEAQPEIQAEDDRDRVRRVLRVVQGHPKLMELADAAAADRDRLDAQLAEAEAQAEAALSSERSSAGDPLGTFFRTGESPLDPAEFLATLTAWTTTAVDVLPPEARLMAEFVAFLEDADRRSDVIEDNWAALWRRLERPGEPSDPKPLLAVLASAALVEAQPMPSAGPGNQSGAEGGPGARQAQHKPMSLRMHPGVAAAIAGARAARGPCPCGGRSGPAAGGDGVPARPRRP